MYKFLNKLRKQIVNKAIFIDLFITPNKREILPFDFAVLTNDICCRFALVTFHTLHDTKTISWGVLPLICCIQAYIASSIFMNLCRVNWMQNLI